MQADKRPLWLVRAEMALADWHCRWRLQPRLASGGDHCRVIGPRHVHIDGKGVHLGRHVHLFGLPELPVRLTTWHDGDTQGRVSLGDYCVINPGVRVVSAVGITIGPGSMLAQGAYITDADWHGIHHRVFPPGATGPVVLGSNVWVADGATVLKGVSIGDNSIVAARAVVTRDVPANTIVAGNPARAVRTLDPDAPGTTRRDLFETMAYPKFEQQWLREQYGNNRLWPWLRSRVLPGPGD